MINASSQHFNQSRAIAIQTGETKPLTQSSPSCDGTTCNSSSRFLFPVQCSLSFMFPMHYFLEEESSYINSQNVYYYSKPCIMSITVMWNTMFNHIQILM
jgi:hypothetical protein